MMVYDDICALLKKYVAIADFLMQNEDVQLKPQLNINGIEIISKCNRYALSISSTVVYHHEHYFFTKDARDLQLHP